MSNDRHETADGKPGGRTLPSYRQWIALPDSEQQKRRTAARAHLDDLRARYDAINAYDDLNAFRRLCWEIDVAEYDVLPYDATTISYKEWAALPKDERDQVKLALQKHAVELQRRYPSMTDAECDAYEAEHRRLVQDFVEERARTGSDILGDVAIGNGHLVTVLSGYPIRPQPPLRYDPATISYKQWIAMRGEERQAVLRALDDRNHVESEPIRDGDDGEGLDEEFLRLTREMDEEVERTGIRANGAVLLGNGIVINIRYRTDSGKKYRPPPD